VAYHYHIYYFDELYLGSALEYPSSIGLEPENETGYTGLVGGMYEDFVELYFEISVNGNH
jgi:hypothetical protein